MDEFLAALSLCRKAGALAEGADAVAEAAELAQMMEVGLIKEAEQLPTQKTPPGTKRLKLKSRPQSQKPGRRPAYLILLAQDLSDNTRQRMERWGESTKVLSIPYTMEQLGPITRKKSGVLAVTDPQLAKLCLKKHSSAQQQ